MVGCAYLHTQPSLPRSGVPRARAAGARSGVLLQTRSTVSMHGVGTHVFGALRGDRPSGDDVTLGARSPGHRGLRVQVWGNRHYIVHPPEPTLTSCTPWEAEAGVGLAFSREGGGRWR